jgi:FAD/FMN-containing dehydrogenase
MIANEGTADGMMKELERGFGGQLFAPQDPGYDDARKVYNAMIDRRPALIARCADARDVARTIGFARTHDLPLAVRGGGHSGPGLGVCDDGVVAELSLLNEITVNPETRTARVGGGCTWGQVDRDQSRLRPQQPLPHQPEHRAAGVTSTTRRIESPTQHNQEGGAQCRSSTSR